MALPSNADEPFRFLDLPKELRLMVYEHLPREIKHHHIHLNGDAKLILVTPSVPTAILATCNLVHAEAVHVVNKIVSTFILSKTPKLMSTIDNSAHVFMGIIMAVAVQAFNRLTKTENEKKDKTQGYGKTQEFLSAWITAELDNPRYAESLLHSESDHEMNFALARSWINKAGPQLLHARPIIADRDTEKRLSKLFMYVSLGNNINSLGVEIQLCKHARCNTLLGSRVAIALAGFVPDYNEAFDGIITTPFENRVVPNRDLEWIIFGPRMAALRSMSKEDWEDDWLENETFCVGQNGLPSEEGSGWTH